MQTEGRGRAEDSSYTVVDVKNSGVSEKETVNEYRKAMMDKAINKIGALKQADYNKQVRLADTFGGEIRWWWQLCCCCSDAGVSDSGYNGVQVEDESEEAGGH